jgi:hypothetical protein
MGYKGQIPWNKGKIWSDEIKKKISEATIGRIPWNKNIPCSEKTKKKISIANTGKTWKLSETTKTRQSLSKIGNKNPIWKGDNVGYAALHNWIERKLGKPRICSHCETTTAKKYEWANKSGKYLRDINDYTRLCVKCHQAFDNRKGGVKKIKEE